MAHKDKRILCVDIGCDSVKAAEFSHPREGSILLEKYAYMENGVGDISSDDPEYKVTILETVRNLILANGFLAKNVYLSLSGQNAFIRFVKVPAMTDDPDKIQKLLEFEAKQNIPFEEDEIVYDSQVILSDMENAQVEAMFAIIKNSDAETYIRCMESLKKKVDNVEIAATACYNASNFNGVGSQQCEMVLNIGGRSSTLIFIDQDKFFVRTFLTAGHAITQQISKEFSISYNDAEELKRRHGFVGLGGAYEEPDSVVASTVSKIIRNVMTRLHGEIIRTVNVYRANGGRKPEKLYLTGGSSVMTYTPHFFSEKLRIPVEYLNPFQVVAVSPTVNKEELASVAHLFSEVVGLSMRNTAACPVEISLLPMQRKIHAAMVKKVPYFYASCLAMLFCVFVIYWSFWKQNIGQQALLSESESRKKSTERILNDVVSRHNRLNSLSGDHERVLEMVSKRSRWFDIITTVQKTVPNGIWFTSIKGIEKVQAVKATSAAVQEDPGMGGFVDPFAGGGFGEPDAGKAQETGKVVYIEFVGHIITKSSDNSEATRIYEDFKDNLQKCGLFETFTIDDKDRMERNFVLAEIGENISSFKIEAKLKVPFDK